MKDIEIAVPVCFLAAIALLGLFLLTVYLVQRFYDREGYRGFDTSSRFTRYGGLFGPSKVFYTAILLKLHLIYVTFRTAVSR